MNTIERRVLLGVLLGVITYAILGALTDASAVLDTLRAFPPHVFAATLGLSVLNYALRFGKWHFYLSCLGLRVPAGISLHVFLSGFVMSVTPGKLGEVFKSVLLREAEGIPAATTAPIVLAERLTDLLALFLLASLGVAAFDYGRWVFAISLAVVLAIIAALNAPRLVHAALDRLERHPRLAAHLPKLRDAYASTQALLSARALLIATLLSCVSWSFEGFAFYLILDALGGHDATLFKSIFLFSMGTILGAVSFLPGGLLVAEGSLTGGLLWLKIFSPAQRATAAGATTLIRLATLWFGVAVGLVALATFRRRLATRPDHAEPPAPPTPDPDPSAPDPGARS